MDEICDKWGCDRQSLNDVRHWFQTRPHLPQSTPDEYLAQFLHSCYFDVERTKKCIESYFKLKSNSPACFKNRTLEDAVIQKALNFSEMVILPGQTAEGYTMIFGRLTDHNPAKFDYTSWLKYLFMLIDLALRERPGCPGFCFVYDFRGYSFRHLFKLSISFVRSYFEYFQEACPARSKGVHIMNSNQIMNNLISLGRPFMSKETYNSMHTYLPSQFENLLKVIPVTSIPKDFGGTAPETIKLQEDTIRRLRAHAEWFRFNETLAMDES